MTPGNWSELILLDLERLLVVFYLYRIFPVKRWYKYGAALFFLSSTALDVLAFCFSEQKYFFTVLYGLLPSLLFLTCCDADFIRCQAFGFFADFSFGLFALILTGVNSLLGFTESVFAISTFEDTPRAFLNRVLLIGGTWLAIRLTEKLRLWEKVPAFLVWLYMAFSFFFLLFPVPFDDSDEAATTLGVYTVFIFLIIAAFASVFVMERKKDRQRIQELEHQRQMQFDYYRSLSGMLQEFRLLRHDLKNYLSVQELLADQDGQHAALMEELRERVAAGERVELSSDPYLNAVLYDKSKAAHQRQIKLVCQTFLPENVDVDPLALVCVVANLLDNALEAGRPGDEVEFSCTYKAGLVVVQITNPIHPGAHVPEQTERGFTTKRGSGHGLGLESARRAASANGGSVVLKEKGDRVVATAVLQRTQKSEDAERTEVYF